MFTTTQPEIRPSQMIAGPFGPKPAALLVGPYEDDRIALGRIFQQQNWKLTAAGTLSSALQFLSHTRVPVLISEDDLPGCTWKDVFLKTRDLPHAPKLIVISRQADEQLWSEVLNLGGHDVLMRPVNESQVRWVFGHAFETWQAELIEGRASSRQPRVARSAA